MKPSERSSAARLTDGAIEVCSSEAMTPESATTSAAFGGNTTLVSFAAQHRGLDLRNLDASGVIFTDAYFRGADLRGLDLRQAQLEGASLAHAQISGAYVPVELTADEILMSVNFGTRLRYNTR
mgnify:CR=1 FL=1